MGGSTADPSLLYTVDYEWDSGLNNAKNYLDVVKIDGGLAYLQSVTEFDGWVGNVFVRGSTAYTSAQVYTDPNNYQGPQVELHQVDLSNPLAPKDSVVSGPQGWGWLLDVEGDRMMVTSGWGQDGLDIYRLSPNTAPKYDQFVRTRGWWIDSAARQNNQIFLSSGYWGVQTVTLNP